MKLAGSILHPVFSILSVVTLRQHAVLCAAAVLGMAALVASTPAMAKTPSQVFEEVSASVVVVEAYDARGTQIGQGSGVIIAPGEVATNCHVLKNADRLQVRHGPVRYPARVRLSDADRDLCQITAAELTARPAAIGATKALHVGSRVYAVGAPQGLELTLSEGIVSGLREVPGGRFIQTTAPISPGSSGGGLFDENGALVGLTTFYVSEGQNLNFALPVEWLRELPTRHKAQTPAEDSTVRWVAKALVLESRQDWEGLLAHARQWVNAQPKNANAWFNLGVVYERLGQWAKALDAYQQSIRLNPEHADAWYGLGLAYGKLGQSEKAVEANQQSIRLNPEYANAWFGLGWAYGELGQSEKAVDAYQQALRLNPEYADAWYNLGIAYAVMGRRDQVMEVYRRLKGLDAAKAEQFFQKVVLP